MYCKMLELVCLRRKNWKRDMFMWIELCFLKNKFVLNREGIMAAVKAAPAEIKRVNLNKIEWKEYENNVIVEKDKNYEVKGDAMIAEPVWIRKNFEWRKK